ncbi:DUF4188 domain-containing protein [Bacillus sp. PK3_68]|uniref:DUF4188 domain-containing protein n=1 Tax=Bacillus sp. PK3_68 TaxID=2027408 RepID=UPI00217EEE52|nr:DUF4188 domain-containing protein [Bacillus sp. PK3_68]
MFPGRYTASSNEEVVVFIIGMRVNKWWAIHKWLPVFKAMPAMIRELYTNKDLGFLSMESFFGLRTTIMVQYWRSADELMDYAKGQNHLTAWREFNQKIGNNGVVGIYHETYIVPKGQYECMYGNMPAYGLARATGHQAITPELHSARQHLDAGL